MALKLSLRPGEKFVINGAVLQNGDRRAILMLQNKASILREKDIMQSTEANTPARRIYFPVMMMYIAPIESDLYYQNFMERLPEFMGVLRNPLIIKECISLSRDVAAKDFYRALQRCRKLMAYEGERLGHVHSSLSEDGE